MLTAKQALEIANDINATSEDLACILDCINQCALEGRLSITYHSRLIGDSDTVESIVSKLSKLGYKTTHNADKNTLLIDWSKAND